MNTKLILVALATLVTIGAFLKFYNFGNSRVLPADPVASAWTQWKQDQNRSYGTNTEESYRLGCFTRNYARVNAHNSGNNTSTLKLNKFADMESQEFAAMYTGAKRSSGMRSQRVVKQNLTGVPVSYDARDHGLVSNVKDQGQCGSCWAFSAVGAVEGARAKAGRALQQFAEQQVVDCDVNDGNMGCNGGFMDRALVWIRENPLALETDYRYTARDGTCKAVSSTPGEITGSSSVMADAAEVRAAIYNRGPVSAGIEADQYAFQLYDGGVITSGCGSQIDHGFTAVGFGNDGSSDYFIVKNSWGASWGMNGYVNIAPSQCGIVNEVVYATAA